PHRLPLRCEGAEILDDCPASLPDDWPALLRLVAEVGARDALLQVLERPEVFDDVAPGVVEEDLATLVPADGHEPLEVVPILEEVVDGLAHPAARDDRDLGAGRLLVLFGHRRHDLQGRSDAPRTRKIEDRSAPPSSQ